MMAAIEDKKDFLRFIAQTNDEPLAFQPVRSKGIYLYDVDDKAYVDLISGITVAQVGHSHPEVISAIKAQTDLFLHTMVYGEHIQTPQVAYAKALVDTLPDYLNNVYWVNSGSEAIEGAMKLAKKYTGRSEMISCTDAYHGSTHGALALMDNAYFTGAYRPLVPGVKHMKWNQVTDLALITEQTAAVFIETIQGEAGYRVPSHAYMRALRDRCDETGTLLVLDEIQAGLGRSGKLWAFEHFGIEPDILCLAKSVGGGLPLGCFISDQMIMSCLKDNPVLGHITTFGGNPLSCAAGKAAFSVIIEHDLTSQIELKSELFRTRLSGHALVKNIRGIGFMLAVELDSFDQVQSMMRKGLEFGFLTDWFLHEENAFRISPPLTMTTDEIHLACDLIIAALNAIQAAHS